MSVTQASVQRAVDLSQEAVGREIFRRHGAHMRIKKEATAIRNLSRIIEATLLLANRKGFGAMSLRDLSAETQMSMGGLYAYIRSKDDLVDLIQTHGRALTDRVLQHELANLESPTEQLAGAIRAHLYLSDIARRWFFFSYMEARLLGDDQKQQAVASEQQTEALLAEIIRAGQAQQLFRGVDAQLAAAMIKALLQDWYVKHGKYRQRQLSVEDYADSVLELIERYLLC